MGQDQVSGGVSVLCWLAAPVAIFYGHLQNLVIKSKSVIKSSSVISSQIDVRSDQNTLNFEYVLWQSKLASKNGPNTGQRSIITTFQFILFKHFFVDLSRRLKCTIVITRCRSSDRPTVRPSSVRRLSVINFSHLRLFLWNRWTEFNEGWQEARSQRHLPSMCFSGRSENKIAALASDWLKHFQLLLWNRWTELNETWQKARSQCDLPSLCFSGRSEKQDGHPGLWLAETFLTSPLKPLNGI